MRRARVRDALSVFTLRNYAYEDRKYYEHVDHVFTTSPYLTNVYRERIGLKSVGIDSPIEWGDVEAPEEMRRFVTFVNPSLHKGSMLFARLADMLGSARSDIPILVVQSANTAGRLNAIPGLDVTKYPHIMAAPGTPRPADFFALTRILLVPSTFAEPFGRVAAEALINGIPPLVSDRGALPQTVGTGGVVLPLPDWLHPERRRADRHVDRGAGHGVWLRSDVRHRSLGERGQRGPRLATAHGGALRRRLASAIRRDSMKKADQTSQHAGYGLTTVMLVPLLSPSGS